MSFKNTFKYFSLVCVYMDTCICMCICACGNSWRPEEDIESPGTGVAGGCHPLNMGARNQAQVFCKSTTAPNHGSISPQPRYALSNLYFSLLPICSFLNPDFKRGKMRIKTCKCVLFKCWKPFKCTPFFF